MLVYTIGYGSREITTFIDILRRYHIELVVDTRSIPYSRFRPDFRRKIFQEHLAQAGIDYWYTGEELGGKRVDSACMVDGKIDLERLYALPSFRAAIESVADAVRQGQVLALMCAEQRPENCHRSWMLAPQMEARNISVLHIDEQGGLKTQQEVRGWFENA